MSISARRKLYGLSFKGHAWRWITGLSLLIMVTGHATAQNHFRHNLRSPSLVLEGRVYYGWTLDHHIEMTPYKRHYPAYEISLIKATYGRARWEYMYNYPLVGLSYWYSDLGKTRPLGSGHAVFPFINFPLLSKKGFNIYFRLGVGIGYLTRKYDRYENYENLAIGSHINGAVNLLLEGRLRLGGRFIASGGISLMHFSNGAIKQPNYGLNMPGINVSLAYRISRENPYLSKKLLPELIPFEFDGKRFLQLDLNAAAGIKDLQATLGGGNQYAVADLAGNLLWPVSFKSRLGFGIDLSYDGSDEKLLEIRGIIPKHRIDLVKTGITGSYELAFSRMAIMLNLGVTVSGLNKRDGFVYEKLAIRVGITEKL
ncbi:MAG: acyloxyacyl hydrolase, partial [Bacteroidales bacterium]|nr:acyloxyacyl hydrolase [Bacteroidales bacterium]